MLRIRPKNDKAAVITVRIEKVIWCVETERSIEMHFDQKELLVTKAHYNERDISNLQLCLDLAPLLRATDND